MWKSKKSYLYLLPFICFCALLGLSKNANAVTKDYNALSFSYNTPWSQSYQSTGLIAYNQAKFNIHAIREVATRITGVTVPANANYMSYTGKFNLLTWTDNGYIGYLPESMDLPYIYVVRINGSSYNFESSSIKVYKTDFQCDPLDSGIWTNCRTFTYEVSFVIKNQPSSISNIVVGLEYSDGTGNVLFSGYRDGFNAYFEPDQNNYVSVDFAFDYTSAILQQQYQLQAIMNNNITEINNSVNEVNNNLNEINDSITDSTVTGSFNTSPIQPFGPIGTITTSILELPRIILNVNSCSPLTPELPYINENIEIPCPSTILNGMAGGFMTFLDTITSAGIWFILARYIFRKVQKLRDPENTDEEYLDI